MIKAIILDDSADACEFLQMQISKVINNINVIGTATNIFDGAKLIKDQKPDLVFLDIDLNGQTGFDLLDMLDQINFEVIFTTGHNEFAVEAFKYNAVHYLTKPVDSKELYNAVERAESRLAKSNIQQSDKIKSLLKSIKIKKLTINTEDATRFVPYNHIVYIKADGNYSEFMFTDNKKLLVAKALKEYEKILDEDFFYRLSKSYLINLNHIKLIHRIDGGTIEMHDGTKIVIPRRKREEFMMKMGRLS